MQRNEGIERFGSMESLQTVRKDIKSDRGATTWKISDGYRKRVCLWDGLRVEDRHMKVLDQDGGWHFVTWKYCEEIIRRVMELSDSEVGACLEYLGSGSTLRERLGFMDSGMGLVVSVGKHRRWSSRSGVVIEYPKEGDFGCDAERSLRSREVAEVFALMLRKVLPEWKYKVCSSRENYLVQRTEIPCVSLELGYCTSKMDVLMMMEPSTHRKIAKGIVEGLRYV